MLLHEFVYHVHISANREVNDAHVEVLHRLSPLTNLNTRADASGDASLDCVLLGFPDLGVVVVAGPPDAHGVITGSELHHIDAWNVEDGFQVFDRFAFFDHDRHHGLIGHLHPIAERYSGEDIAHIARARGAGDAAVRRRLRANGLARVRNRPNIREQQVLDTGSRGLLRQVCARLLIDLHHGRHVIEQLDCTGEVVEGE